MKQQFTQFYEPPLAIDFEIFLLRQTWANCCQVQLNGISGGGAKKWGKFLDSLLCDSLTSGGTQFFIISTLLEIGVRKKKDNTNTESTGMIARESGWVRARGRWVADWLVTAWKPQNSWLTKLIIPVFFLFILERNCSHVSAGVLNCASQLFGA